MDRYLALVAEVESAEKKRVEELKARQEGYDKQSFLEARGTDVLAGVSGAVLGGVGLGARIATDNPISQGLMRAAGEDDALLQAGMSPSDEINRANSQMNLPQGFVRRNLTGVVQNLTNAVAVGGAAKQIGVDPYTAMIAQAALQRTSEGLTEASDAGLEGVGRYGYAAGQGAIEGGITAAGGKWLGPGVEGQLAKLIGGSVPRASLKSAIQQTVKSFGAELAEEEAITLSDMAFAKFAGVDKKAFSAAEIGQAVLDTAAQTAGMSGVAGAPSIVQGAIVDAEKGAIGKEKLEALKSFKNSDTRKAEQKQLREQIENELSKPESAAQVIRDYEQEFGDIAALEELAKKDSPSRNDFAKAQLPVLRSGKARAQFAQSLRDVFAGNEAAQSGVNEVTRDDLSEEQVQESEAVYQETDNTSDPFTAVKNLDDSSLDIFLKNTEEAYDSADPETEDFNRLGIELQALKQEKQRRLSTPTPAAQKKGFKKIPAEVKETLTPKPSPPAPPTPSVQVEATEKPEIPLSPTASKKDGVKLYPRSKADTSKRIYRETSLDKLERFLPFGTVIADSPFGAEVKYFAPNPDIALGQGDNHGVVMEFDGDGVKTKTAPTPSGDVELIYDGRESDLKERMLSFSIKPSAISDKTTIRRLNNLIRSSDWEGKRIGEWIVYSRPDVAWEQREVPSPKKGFKKLAPEVKANVKEVSLRKPKSIRAEEKIDTKPQDVPVVEQPKKKSLRDMSEDEIADAFITPEEKQERQLWEMTKQELEAIEDEIHSRQPSGIVPRSKSGDLAWRSAQDAKRKLWRAEYKKAIDDREKHKDSIVRAISEGKRVPDAVIADYPELSTTPEEKKEVATTTPVVEQKKGFKKQDKKEQSRASVEKTKALSLDERVDILKDIANTVAPGRPIDTYNDTIKKKFVKELEGRGYEQSMFKAAMRTLMVKREPKEEGKGKNKGKLPAPSPLSSEIEKTNTEYLDLLEQMRKAAKESGLGVNPQLNPKLAGLAVKVAAKWVKLRTLQVADKVLTFAEFINEMRSQLGDATTKALRETWVQGWKRLKEFDEDSQLGDVSDFDEIFASEKEQGSEVTRDGGMGDAPREPGADGTGVAEQQAQVGDTGGVPEQDSASVPRRDGGDAGSQPEPELRGDEGDAGTRVPDQDQRELGGEGGVDAGSTTPTGEVQSPVRVNHRIAGGDVIAPDTQSKKLKSNLEAIRTLLAIEKEGREATDEEKKKLVSYVGWGGLAPVFDKVLGEAMESKSEWRRNESWEKQWGKAYVELKALLTPEEWSAARDTTVNAHYTSRPIINAMWGIARKLGFTGGRVLEPGAGVGHFIGLRPEGLDGEFTAVEMDSISSRLMKAAYPSANILNMDMNEARLVPNSQDLVIGNVPFAAAIQPDSVVRYGKGLNLHNYFIARSIDALRPGGVGVLITTHRTMDSVGEQREFLASRGELIGAIRLPNNAFQDNANTEVTTDILIFRKPLTERVGGEGWSKTSNIKVDGGKNTASVNEYFVSNPEMVLGEHSMTGKMYSRQEDQKEYTLLPNQNTTLEEAIQKAISKLPANIMQEGERSQDVVEETAKEIDGDFRLNSKGGVVMIVNGKEFEIGKGKAPEGYYKSLADATVVARGKEYIRLRDHYKALHSAMLLPETTDEDVKKMQKELNKLYDSYIGKHGVLGDAKTNLFKSDSGYYLVRSLEKSNISTTPEGKRVKTYRKADVFTKRTIGPRIPPVRVSTLREAVNVSLSYRGRLDTQYISELYGKSSDEVVKELMKDGVAFINPKTGLMEHKERYLSGNVRKKLEEAKVAAGDDAKYEENVKALTSVQPARVTLDKISYKLGSAWIPSEVIEGFSRKLFSSPYMRVQYVPETDSWMVSATANNATALSTYGVQGGTDEEGREVIAKTAGEILSDLLNLRIPEVQWREYYVDDNGKSRSRPKRHDARTHEAKQKAAAMQKEFIKHINSLPELQKQIEEIYNEKFNAYVDPVFDGSGLELPGASTSINLRSYQKNAIYRILQEGKGFLAHAVGSGKTYQMIAAAMESRRLGLAKRPMIVVQNATLGQFATSFMEFYPGAKVLVATKDDLAKDKRKLFLARVTTGDWDAVVVPQSVFDGMKVSKETEKAYFDEQISLLEEMMQEKAAEEGKSSPTVKNIVRAISSLKKRLEKSLSSKKEMENPVNFDELGVDQLFIDEIHAYKKPFIVTKLDNLVGLNKQASARGIATYLKTRSVHARNGEGRGVIGATGTPVTNTLGELWHMLNFVNPSILEEAGVGTFDRFVSTFAVHDTILTQNAGGAWVLKDALVRYTNGEELSHIIRSTFDVVTPDELNAYFNANGGDGGIPKLVTGAVQGVTIPQTAQVKQFTDYLKQVYEKFQKLSGKEKRRYSYIAALVYNANRAAALDIRLVDPSSKPEKGGKIDATVERALKEYERSKEMKGTQLIFSDTFNPVNMSKINQFMEGEEVQLDYDAEVEDEASEEQQKEDARLRETKAFLFNDIKAKLIKGGVPENEIAIVAEYKTDKQREELFAQVKEGNVRFLLGSTARMGVGVNVQDRLVALHHLDSPWLPADLEQREGRILRFGNMNKEVSIFRYAMEKTLDGAIYLNLARKTKFVWQALSGKAGREFEDPASQGSMSLEEQFAVINGDKDFFNKLNLERDIRDLQFELDNFNQAKKRATEDIAYLQSANSNIINDQIPTNTKLLEDIRANINENGLVSGGKKIADKKDVVKFVDQLVEEVEEDARSRTRKRELARPEGMSGMSDLAWADEETIRKSSAIREFTLDGWRVRLRSSSGEVMSADGSLQWRNWTRFDIFPPIGKRTNLYHGEGKTGAGLYAAIRNIPKQVEGGLEQARDKFNRNEKDIAELLLISNAEFNKSEELERKKAELESINSGLLAKKDPEKKEEGDSPAELTSPSDIEKIIKSARTSRSKEVKNKREVDEKAIRAAFPQSIIRETPKGWRVEVGGSFVDIEVMDTIPLDAAIIRTMEKRTGVKYTKEMIAQLGTVMGSFSVVDRKNGKFHTGLGVIQLLKGMSKDDTLRHEALHLAYRSGLFTPKEWNALVKKYSSPMKSIMQQEEDIAGARQVWEKEQGVWGRVASFLRRLLAAMGVRDIDADDVFRLMDEASFWKREGKRDGGKEKYDTPTALDPEKIKRNRLANYGTTEEAKKLVAEKIDPTRPLPEKRRDVDVQREAEERLAKDYGGEKRKYYGANPISPATDVDQLVAKSIADIEANKVLQSDDKAKIAEAVRVGWMYRDDGTNIARIFRQRREALYLPYERMVKKITDAILTPPQKVQKELEEAMRSGDKEGAARITQEYADRIIEMKSKLKALGVDLDNLWEGGYNKNKMSEALVAIGTMKGDTWDMLYEYWRNSILSSPTTQVANVLGNFGNAGWYFLGEKVVEAGVNTITQRPEGAQLGELKYVVSGFLPGVVRGWQNALSSWRTELPQFATEVGRETADLETYGVSTPGKLGKVLRYPQRMLLFADELAKSMFAEMEAGAIAYRIAKEEGKKGEELQARTKELVDDVTSKAWDAAFDKAQELAFQQEGSAFTKGAKSILLNARKRFPILSFVIPFITTPANIFETAISKSPLGSISLAMGMYRNYRKGENVFKGMSAKVAQQFIAYAVVAALLALNDPDEPWITGAEDSFDPKKRELAIRSKRPPLSIKIGGKWWSYARIEPFATALGTTIDITNSLKRSGEDGSWERVLGDSIESLRGQLREKTFLDGLADLVTIFTSGDATQDAAKWSSDFAVTWVPMSGLVRSFGRAARESAPERGVWGNADEWAERLGKRTVQKIEAGLIPDSPKHDLWGKEIETSRSPVPRTDFLYRLLIPSQNIEGESTDMDRLIVNYNNTFPDDAVYPLPPQRYYKFEDKTVYLTDEQYSEYTKLAGEIGLKNALKEDWNPSTPDKEQIDRLGEILADARRIAREQLIPKWREGKQGVEDIDLLSMEEEISSLGDALPLSLSSSLREKYGTLGEARRDILERNAQTLTTLRGKDRAEIERVFEQSIDGLKDSSKRKRRAVFNARMKKLEQN